MANRAPARHTKQIAWRLENGCYVFARGQAVCDLEMVYAKVFGIEVKLRQVLSFKVFGNYLNLSKNLGAQ